MGKYFKDETLDGLWGRLVNATESVTGAAPAYRWVIEDIKPPEDMPDYEPTFLIEGDYLTTIVDVYTLEGVGPFHTTFPISLSELDTNKTYKILDTPSGLGTGTLVYKYASGLKNTGLTGIHDALILYTGLIHDHFPTTPGDYMKGISVAANYYTNNNEMDSTTKNTLAEIVDRLEHSCYLSDDMVLTIGGSLYESGFRLFDADTEELLVQEDRPRDYTTYDLKNYYQFQYGKRYYAIADLVMEYYDEDEDLYYHQNYYIRSNEVECNFVEDYVFALSDDLYLTGNREPDNLYDIYLTLYRNNEPIGDILGAYGAVPYDFLNGDWADDPAPTLVSGDYYATISWDNQYAERVTYTTNVVEFSGMAHVRITVKNSGMYASTNQAQGSSLSINGVTYRTPEEITVPIGTNIECSVRNNSGGNRSYDIYLNNVEVTYGIYDEYGASYVYTVKRDTDIVLSSGATMGQYGPTGETESISITEL